MKRAWSVIAGLVLAVAALGTMAAAGAGESGTIPPTKVFASTGAEQVYTVPANVTLVETDLNGGTGGGGDIGAPIGGYLAVAAGEKLFVEVGANGAYGGGTTFGGGGAAGASPCSENEQLCGTWLAASGGGASDIRTCSEHAVACPGGSLASRLEVAGGGAGAGGTGSSPGWYCTEMPQKGLGWNSQVLPKGDPASGPIPIKTSQGLVVPGEPANFSYGPAPIKDVGPAQGGSIKPGVGGTLGSCSVYEVNDGSVLSETYTGSIGGKPGSGSNGGAGGNVTGHFSFEGPSNYLPGAGGGGGGGYTGGGGGSTGSICTYNVKGGPCYDPSGGAGGGGGSSFFSKQVIQPIVYHAPPSGPSVMVTPLVKIDAPRNGAVYKAGQVVRAQYTCGHDQGFGCEGSTVPVGTPIDMKPGKHTFGVKTSLSPTGQIYESTVTYTVR